MKVLMINKFLHPNGGSETYIFKLGEALEQHSHEVQFFGMDHKRQVDRLIAAYFTEGCDDATRIKIYCYIATCGLLWSNWCEYKRN